MIRNFSQMVYCRWIISVLSPHRQIFQSFPENSKSINFHVIISRNRMILKIKKLIYQIVSIDLKQNNRNFLVRTKKKELFEFNKFNNFKEFTWKVTKKFTQKVTQKRGEARKTELLKTDCFKNDNFKDNYWNDVNFVSSHQKKSYLIIWFDFNRSQRYENWFHFILFQFSQIWN